MRKIFTLLILLLLLPVTALAAAPQTLYVGDYQITNGSAITYLKAGSTAGSLVAGSENDWTVKYEPSTATLTLNGATIQGGTSTGSVPYGAGIYAQCSNGQSVTLTIKLIGKNTITGYYGIYVNAEISENSNGTDASLTITGENNGSLEVSGSFYGIFVKSGTGNASVTIENASVDAKTTQTNSGYAGVCVQSGASSKDSPNLSLAVNGGSLTTSGSASGDGIQFVVGSSQASNATTRLTVSDNAIVRANGGIKASRVDKPTPSGTGIVFDGMEGTVYGNVTLQEDLEIGEGESLTIPEGSTLNTNNNLTNNGTIVNTGGTLNGEPDGTGKIETTPTIDTQPASQTVTEGNTATFTVAATGGNLSYQWQQSTDNGQSWTDISGANAATYTTAATTTSMNGYQYRCVVINSAGSVTSNAVTLTVNQGVSPTSYSISANVAPAGAGTVTVNGSGTSATVTANSDVTLTATANDGYRFTGWMENDRQVSTDATYTFKATGDRTLTAKFEKKVTGVTLNTETLELFTGGSATLTATVEPSDAANQNVTWQSDNANVATVEGGTVTAVGAGETTITVQTQDGNYTASCTVTVTKPEEPKPPIDQPSYYNIYVEDVCNGVEVTTSKNVVREGGSISLYVEKDTANYTFDNFQVYYKRSYYGPWEVLEEGVQPGEYPINNIWTHIYIKAEGAEEKEEDPTGIEQVEGVKVYTKNGSLYVQTPQREQVLIISMTGAVVKNEEQIGLKQYHGLQPGIYIVRVGDRAYKVRLN